MENHKIEGGLTNNRNSTIPNKEMWIIDSDPGCDDLFCLLYMLNRKDIEIMMISLVEGNTTMPNVEINMRKILKLTKKENTPIFTGAGRISSGTGNAHHVHGEDGLGNIEEFQSMQYNHIDIKEGNAATNMCRLLERYPGQINVLMIGPLTNLAVAYMLNPNIPNLIKNLWTMGGSLHSRGNISPAGEFNYTFDYIASKIVLSNFKNVILIPWEPIEKHKYVIEEFLQIKNDIVVSNREYHKDTCDVSEKLFHNFTKNRGGLMICDFYAAICYFNHQVVQSCFLAECDLNIDTESLRGSLSLKKRKKCKSFQHGLEELHKMNKIGWQLVVDVLDRKTITSEIYNIYYS
jgi:inosine-uridine nucleoside N-ribohydrolase